MKVAALGAGRMGRGIGHVFAYAGFEVDVIDFKPRSQSIARDALAEIRGNLSLLKDLGLVTDVDRITLFRSHLSSAGSTYVALAHALLVLR